MKNLFLVAILFMSMSYTSNAQDAMLAEVKLFAGNFAPRGWAFCEGQLLPISRNQALFALLGTTYGGDGRITFALPDLRGRVPVGPGTGPGLASIRLGQKSNGKLVSEGNRGDSDSTNSQPTLGLHYIIALQGVFPSRS